MQARNFTTNVSKILDLKSSSEQIFFRKLSLGAPESSLYSCPFSSERRVHESLFAWMVGLIHEVSIKRIHIEENIRGHFLSVCLRSQ